MNDLSQYTKDYDLEALRTKQNRYKDKHQERLNERNNLTPIHYPDISRAVGFEEYKTILAERLKEIIGFMPKYTEDKAQKIRNVVRWIVKEEGSLDTNKGLILIGDFGTGKTTLLDAIYSLNRSAKHITNIDSYKKIQYKRTVKKAIAEGWVNKLYPAHTEHLYIDDLGFLEEDKIKHYGNELNVVADLITDRYERWRARKHKTIISTNMTLDHIYKTYGRGIYGRLLEMTNVIEWEGEDYRLSKLK